MGKNLLEHPISISYDAYGYMINNNSTKDGITECPKIYRKSVLHLLKRTLETN